ncbi:hypothetical protein C1645_118857 [Glomus cerebriforme]|uniref:CCHC-type domain-containing protein n=1 Tax=Glomus cerebriforme TaxID=658196 RepID=A0A397SZV1_9GLOM|nr:hypothetical protein C1645_118857 [Glomus cerebriforme]
MAESELNPISIYNNLINLRIKPQSGGKNANSEAQLISSLRIDTASVLKEVSRFRACDAGSCFYCREWALFIYKKNFNVKNQGQNVNGNDVNSSAETENKKPKETASEIWQQFNDDIIKYGEKVKLLGTANEMQTDLVDLIVQKVFAWIKSPSSLYAPPDFFIPIEFDKSQQAVVNSEHENDILEAIEIEKSHLQIQKNSFPLLKHINKVQKCNHTRPDWKNPSDLDLDRRVFNDQLFKEACKNGETLAESLGQVWLYVNNFLTSILQLEETRESIFGKGCVANLSNFLKEYQDECLPFNEYWSPVAEAYKKSGKSKKGISSPTNTTNVVEDIDTAFSTYVNNARTVISFWEEGFIEKVFNSAIHFGEETQQLLISIIVESEGRLVNGRVPEFHSNILQKCNDALRTAKHIKSLISKRVSILRTEITKKNKDLIQELEAIENSYKNESQKTLQGRLEKANNKEFRKRIKKFENTIHGTRQYTINSIGNLFPVTDFMDICTRCLEILMMEGEMWEAVQLGRHYKTYEATSQKLESRRQQILKYHIEGIETGRKVLSDIIGRLFLKEAQRQQDETLALEKQESFLQSMGQNKKKKKSEKDQSTVELVESSVVSTDNPKKNNSKKNKKRKNTASSVDKETGSESKSEMPLDTKFTSKPEMINHKVINDSQKQSKQQFLTDMIAKNGSNDNPKSVNSETASMPLPSSSQSNSTSNNKANETTERRLSIPPGLSPPGDTYSNPTPIDQKPPSNEIYDDKLNLDALSRSDLIMLIQNLSTEKIQLVNTLISMQQEVKAMTVRYANLVEMARDREFQIETRKQQEMEEAKKYIQTLELRISQLEKQNIVGNNNSESTSPKSGSSPGSPIGISSTQSSGFSLFPTNRTGQVPLIGSKKYMNPWRGPTSTSRPFSNMRCGNCGDQGHVSQECTVGCRYCGNSEHLSENCDSPNSNFANSSGGEESGMGINSDKIIDQNGPNLF